jgi:hypothetical protein
MKKPFSNIDIQRGVVKSNRSRQENLNFSINISSGTPDVATAAPAKHFSSSFAVGFRFQLVLGCGSVQT